MKLFGEEVSEETREKKTGRKFVILKESERGTENQEYDVSETPTKVNDGTEVNIQ